MQDKRNIEIIIVEDEALIAEDIRDICDLAGYQVTKICYNGRQALTALTNQTFDLAILDINLESELNGFDIADFIKLQKIGLPYIFLTSYSDHATLSLTRDYHPLAYITKPFRKEQLISSIEISFMKNSSYTKHKEIPRHKLLTDRESEIAEMICIGMSNEDIANKVCLSVNTIKYHIKKVYEKLEVNNRIQLLKIMKM